MYVCMCIVLAVFSMNDQNLKITFVQMVGRVLTCHQQSIYELRVELKHMEHSNVLWGRRTGERRQPCDGIGYWRGRQ